MYQNPPIRPPMPGMAPGALPLIKQNPMGAPPAGASPMGPRPMGPSPMGPPPMGGDFAGQGGTGYQVPGWGRGITAPPSAMGAPPMGVNPMQQQMMLARGLRRGPMPITMPGPAAY